MMRVLLDSHVYIWRVSKDRRMPARIRKSIDEAEQVYVSTATIWELSIKAARGKLEPRAAQALDELEAQPFIVLPVQLKHAKAVRDMPDLHRDPFDRLLVAQARTESLRFLTVDSELSEYLAETTEA
ncbi:type II toxin-antitoxin system VapC family toxin [Caballeronia insecticola]|uniref:PilT protein domain protein n=1 Tax=Caballeronia insecticola TaxID=758793 RepID=R4WJW9_9BURK|nr:type II toxin-antitoxin system VapC family toxin [Caballeronia insecticola]BAN24808.1 PilT protein domain protein [Caballeronia insecticola]